MTEEQQTMTEATEQAATEADAITALQAELAAAQAALAAQRDQHLRAAAEAENTRKRVERDMETSRKYASERLLGELLAVCDSLDLGMNAAVAPEVSVKTLADGMELTRKQLIAFFDKHGVKQVDPAGQPFNPDLHEAVSTVPSAEVPPNHVVAVMQKGYRLHERLLRPAMVVVSKSTSG